MAHYPIQSHLVDSTVDVWRDETYLTHIHTQLRLSGVRWNHTQSQQPGASCACSGMASHSSTNFLFFPQVCQCWAKSDRPLHPHRSQLLVGGSDTPRSKWRSPGLFLQVDRLHLLIFLSALSPRSLLSVALKGSWKTLAHFSEKPEHHRSFCWGDGPSSWRTGPRLWTVKVPRYKVSSPCLPALRLHQGAVISAAFLCLFFSHTLTLASSCCGQNLDSSFNIMFLHPDRQYLGAPQAQKTRVKESCLALAEKITQKFPWVQPTHSALLLIHRCVFLQMWHYLKGK